MRHLMSMRNTDLNSKCCFILLYRNIELELCSTGWHLETDFHHHILSYHLSVTICYIIDFLIIDSRVQAESLGKIIVASLYLCVIVCITWFEVQIIMTEVL
jgi:hypothetical protein